MQNRHEQEVHNKFDTVKHNVIITNDVSSEASLGSLKSRLINIVNRIHGAELFDNGLLTLNDLDNAKSLDEITEIVDNYLAITDFYETNYRTFHFLIKEEFFKEKLKDIRNWNELLRHTISYKKLNSEQSTAFVMSTLANLHHEHHPVEDTNKKLEMPNPDHTGNEKIKSKQVEETKKIDEVKTVKKKHGSRKSRQSTVAEVNVNDEKRNAM